MAVINLGGLFPLPLAAGKKPQTYLWSQPSESNFDPDSQTVSQLTSYPLLQSNCSWTYPSGPEPLRTPPQTHFGGWERLLALYSIGRHSSPQDRSEIHQKYGVFCTFGQPLGKYYLPNLYSKRFILGNCMCLFCAKEKLWGNQYRITYQTLTYRDLCELVG